MQLRVCSVQLRSHLCGGLRVQRAWPGEGRKGRVRDFGGEGERGMAMFKGVHCALQTGEILHSDSISARLVPVAGGGN